MEPVLIAKGISKTYRTTQGRVLALESISFQVSVGEFLCIVGPSGCGKTTLLRVLGGLLAPTQGAVYLNGEPLNSPRRQIGFVFQKANLMPWRTVLKNVTLPLEVQGIGRTEAHALAQELLELVGLGGFEKAYPHELSIGMQQRVAIARALIHDPAILLLDEPFASLDALTRERMNLELLRIWKARRKTVVMVTHSIQEAVFVADRVLVMSPRPGRIETAVSVSLPRPRQLAMLYSQEFGLLSQRIRRAIR
jgi:NitT/TauT family transport system ATP-binding protein